jgi:hypothetical protein
MNFIKTCNWELHAYVAVFLSCIFFVSFLSSSCATSGPLRLSFGERFALQGRSGRRLHCWLDGLVTRGWVDARDAPRLQDTATSVRAHVRRSRPWGSPRRACFRVSSVCDHTYINIICNVFLKKNKRVLKPQAFWNGAGAARVRSRWCTENLRKSTHLTLST